MVLPGFFGMRNHRLYIYATEKGLASELAGSKFQVHGYKNKINIGIGIDIEIGIGIVCMLR
jgi:hypothetical protein